MSLETEGPTFSYISYCILSGSYCCASLLVMSCSLASPQLCPTYSLGLAFLLLVGNVWLPPGLCPGHWVNMCVVWSYPWTIPCLLVKTCVLLLAPSHHSSLMSKLAPAHGRNPRNCLPNTICGRLRPVGGSGVLWCSSSALTILFVPSLLHGPRLPTISCFAYFIATSSLLPPLFSLLLGMCL